ncbi:hypothetical protein OHB26_17160 [Nocardia sp. NBC_01503]|uniref:TY-Chap domain-containing protein n=1 Tax=Nocardia sp. NBC_01503 TaxID=2975997 RepID=UPI002E7B0C8A|nr:hypothetical protein [Nocardia sp. NBC_01503]WTL35771.1 hypothetical protein OHB26_17160 [Nocardia sp. NBC_01503]
MTAAVNDEVWQEFSIALASFVARLPAWSNLVFEAEGNRFVAFLMSDRVLACEVVCNRYLEPDYRMTPDDEVRMRLDGWGDPERGHNWIRFLAWPAPRAAYRDLTDRVVTALRDVLGVEQPDRLTLKGWPANPDNAPDATKLGVKVVPPMS